MTLHAAVATSGPFSAHAHLSTDAERRDLVVVVVKAVWHSPVGGRAIPVFEPSSPRARPELFAEGPSSIRLPSDLAPHKPGTEVLLLGHARHPLAYRDARWVDVTLAVERDGTLLRKSLRVFGPRTWERAAGGDFVPSQPTRYEDTELCWEWSRRDPAGSVNPIGKPVELGGPCHRIEAIDGGEHPAGFGVVAPHWEPRRSRRGHELSDEPTPYPPRDRHPRFHCQAPDDQWLETPLVGGETFIVTGVHPRSAWTFVLPSAHPEVVVKIGRREERLFPHLDTVILDADRERVELGYRVALPAPRALDTVESVRVSPRLSARLRPEWERGLGSLSRVAPV